jgi:hypothetical protein
MAFRCDGGGPGGCANNRFGKADVRCITLGGGAAFDASMLWPLPRQAVYRPD